MIITLIVTVETTLEDVEELQRILDAAFENLSSGSDFDLRIAAVADVECVS